MHREPSTKQIYIYMLFARREVRIGKNCALRLEYSRKRAQFFPIRTDPRLVNNILHFTTEMIPYIHSQSVLEHTKSLQKNYFGSIT